MKKFIMLMAMLLLCLVLVACGGSGESADNGVAEQPEPETNAIEGIWACVDGEMKDGDSIFSAKELEELMEIPLKDMLSLKAYGDGSGELTIFDDTAPIEWEERDGDYALLFRDEDGEVEEIMTAMFKEDKLHLLMVDSYTSDGKERKTEMTYIMEHQGPADAKDKA